MVEERRYSLRRVDALPTSVRGCDAVFEEVGKRNILGEDDPRASIWSVSCETCPVKGVMFEMRSGKVDSLGAFMSVQGDICEKQ